MDSSHNNRSSRRQGANQRRNRRNMGMTKAMTCSSRSDHGTGKDKDKDKGKGKGRTRIPGGLQGEATRHHRAHSQEGER